MYQLMLLRVAWRAGNVQPVSCAATIIDVFCSMRKMEALQQGVSSRTADQWLFND